MINNYAVIMAGGIGSRFWPMSTSHKPKQFLDVLGIGKTLLQLTYERIRKFCPNENIYIVTSDEYGNIVQDQLPLLPKSNILTEPGRKNTAPCVAYSCYKIMELNEDARILIAPSDHLILKEEEFVKRINIGFEACSEDILITLGIKTTRPDTGYGYIEALNDTLKGCTDLKKVNLFKEKPQLELAQKYHQQENYYWNSGMFIWSVKSVIKAFEQSSPVMASLFEARKAELNGPNEAAVIKDIYQQVESISVDYAIMEKATNVYVQPCDIGWTDLGTWGSLKNTIAPKEDENAVLGAQIKTSDSSGNMICNETDQLVVVHGLKDFIVVNTSKSLLICPLGKEQEIKTIVSEIKADKTLSSLI